jgi:hypothetical protein
MKAYTILVAASFATLLGGCATGLTADQQARIAAAERTTAADREIQARLNESSSSIARTLQLIDRIERGGPGEQSSGSQSRGARDAHDASASHSHSSSSGSSMLDARLKIQWRNGSAEELLSTLARQMGIPFKTIGARRALAPVTVVSTNESMKAILTSVGKQIDSGADVVLNKSHQPAVLELRYK